MKFEVCVCLPAGDQFIPHAFQFLNSYLSFPGQCEHDLILLTDFGNESQAEELFCVVPKVRAMGTPDHAKDLSRYEFHCKQSDADCVMYLAGTSYFHRPGWALRALTAFLNLGNQNLFATCGHTGAGVIRPHARSTGIWGSPALFRSYPGWPKDAAGRYASEHLNGCMSDWVRGTGRQVWIVNFGSEYTLDQANADPNGYARGNQTNVLVGDRLSGPGAPRFPWPWQT